MTIAPEFVWTPQDSKTERFSPFQNSPLGLAQCQRQGDITAMNPAFERLLGDGATMSHSPLLVDLIHSQDHAETERLLRELFDGKRNSFQVESQPTATKGIISQGLKWTVWHVAAAHGEPDYALVLAEEAPEKQLSENHSVENRVTEQRLRQAERLEAVGRLAGGVAHDFNNLLTGVLLYCDLLMAHLEPCHRVRKYAIEIRNAGMQATGLVKQLLAVARPTNSEPRLLSLNEIAEGMRNLLVRLIGENIELQFRLDPNLGLIKMDPTQAQQILLNLVLNSRDAMPAGGKITVETCNCKVQVLNDSTSAGTTALLPCALFVVGDEGSGMDDATRSRVFEAFFTTKSGGKGTGLGLATVHDIVTSNGGLIHVDTAPAQGTRISVLLPLVPETVLNFKQGTETGKNEPVLLIGEKE